jgi:hypothetical protein
MQFRMYMKVVNLYVVLRSCTLVAVKMKHQYESLMFSWDEQGVHEDDAAVYGTHGWHECVMKVM